MIKVINFHERTLNSKIYDLLTSVLDITPFVTPFLNWPLAIGDDRIGLLFLREILGTIL